MRARYLLLSTLLLLCCSFASVAQTEFPTLDAFKKSILKAEDQVSVEANGDLNGDGLADWAGVIHRSRPDFGSTNQLYVLLRLDGGGYRVAEKSSEAEIPGMGCCWVEDLAIREASIYVQDNAKTCCTMEAATHQFKLYKGEWRLVGLRIYYVDQRPKTPLTTETDMNVLTGRVIEKKQKGDGKPITTRRQKKFPTAFLKDFDFINFFGAE